MRTEPLPPLLTSPGRGPKNCPKNVNQELEGCRQTRSGVTLLMKRLPLVSTDVDGFGPRPVTGTQHAEGRILCFHRCGIRSRLIRDQVADDARLSAS